MCQIQQQKKPFNPNTNTNILIIIFIFRLFFMSVCSFSTNLRFHLRSSRTMLSTNICCLFCFRFYLLLWFRTVFLTFKNDPTHYCIFYTHILLVIYFFSTAKITLFYENIYLCQLNNLIPPKWKQSSSLLKKTRWVLQ